jgi:GxxExxY protein
MKWDEFHSSKRPEPSEEQDRLAYAVIGAAIEVHRVLRPGYIERVYEKALLVELNLRGIPCSAQIEVAVDYKGHNVGEGRIDLLGCGELVVELKACDVLAPVHTAQLLSYLKATGKKLGLLINFNVPLLSDGVRRVILS